ncbi:MAG: rSAM-modified peptide [Mediterranea massiliensis]|nr:rSAM-modified peptide [Mediterranea massiliensis]
MKKLPKFKLTNLNASEVSEKEMNLLVGGEKCCTCGCTGPSSSVDNNIANYNDNLYSPSGGVQHGYVA